MRLKSRKISGLPKSVWLHCSSGEFEYAKSLIRKIKNKNPHLKIVVTYFSPTYKRQIENFPGVDIAIPCPWDFPGAVTSFLNKFNPEILIVAKTDLWPELLYQCKQRGIPSILFSCHQSKISSWNLPKKLVRKFLINFISEIYTISTQDKLNLIELCPKAQIHAAGDTRYDQVKFRLNSATNSSLKNYFLNSEYCHMICGSTWPEDEKIIVRSIEKLLKNSNIRITIVPHEPHEKNINGLTHLLDKFKMSWATLDNFEGFEQSKVLIVNKMGILADLYPLHDFAFIGGSFRSSVHSVMEALGAGLPTLVGPNSLNNSEVVHFKNVILTDCFPMVQRVENGRQFIQSLNWLLQNQKDRDQFKISIRDEFENQLGATDALFGQLRSNYEIFS